MHICEILYNSDCSGGGRGGEGMGGGGRRINGVRSLSGERGGGFCVAVPCVHIPLPRDLD